MVMMKDLFAKLEKKQFILIAILVCAAADTAIALSIYTKFAVYENFHGILQEMLQVMAMQNPEILEHFNEQMQREFFGIVRLSVLGTILMVFVFHGFVYAGFYFEKKFSYYYVKMMSWLGPVFCVLLGFAAFNGAPLYGYFFLQAILFIFVAKGLSYFRLGHAEA